MLLPSINIFRHALIFQHDRIPLIDLDVLLLFNKLNDLKLHTMFYNMYKMVEPLPSQHTNESLYGRFYFRKH